MTEPVTFAARGPVGWITLDDGKANAINAAWLAAFNDALDRAEQHGGALVITGRPGMFCAGLDLKTLPALQGADLAVFIETFARFMARLFTFGLPTVVACSGHAIAGGALVLLCGDAALGADGPFKIGLTEASIGITLPTFAIELAAARLPPPTWSEVMLEGRRFTPAEARARGFFEAVVAPETLHDAAQARGEALAAVHTAAYAETKRRLRAPRLERGLAAIAREVGGFVRG